MVGFWVYLEGRRFADRLDLGFGKTKGNLLEGLPFIEMGKPVERSIWGED